jgi:hypothetical protein
MGTKKRAAAKKSKSEKPPARPLEKAVPPPDNPLLRHQADDAAREGENLDEQQMAKLRLKALKYTQEMPTSDESEEPTSEDKG